MAQREQLNDGQRRLLRIIARMPLASVSNLGVSEDRVRDMLGRLRRGGWVTSVVRGMTERRQHRWFPTREAVDALYTTDHQHPAPREEAGAAGLAAFRPEGELPEDYRERFALNHHHPAHLDWAFRISSGISEGIYKSMVQSDREFLRVRVGDSTLYNQAA